MDDLFKYILATSRYRKGVSVKYYFELIYLKGVKFDIKINGCLYYLNTVATSKTATRGPKQWHQILGHCNLKGIICRRHKIVDKSHLKCEILYPRQKMVPYQNKLPNKWVAKILDLTHCDLAGPIKPISLNGFKYTLCWTVLLFIWPWLLTPQ